MSENESVFNRLLAGRRSLTDLGAINRANRMYFGLLLKNQADALGVGSAELSGYETGREEPSDEFKAKVHEYWADKFANCKPS